MASNINFKWSSLDSAINYLDNIYKGIQSSKDLKKYNSALYFFINQQYDEIDNLKSKKYNISVKNIDYNKYQILIINTENLPGLEVTSITNLQIFKLQQYSNYLLKDKDTSKSRSLPSKKLYLYIYIILFVIIILTVSKY